MSQSHRGKVFSAEHRAKIGEATRNRPGTLLTAAQRAHLSQVLRGHTVSSETRAKLSAAHKGRQYAPNSPETRARISAANRGRPKSAEHRSRIGAALTGRHLPDAQRERLADLQRNRSAETRAKLSQANGKLTDAQVIKIRQRSAAGERVRALARAFGVGHSSISEIVSGKTYRHLLT
jgi:hypothetical protein